MSLNPLAWSALLAGISSLCFGVLVLLRCPNKKLGRIWFVFNLTVAGWSFGALWLWSTSSSDSAYLAIRIAYAFGIVWIASIFHHFVSLFLDLRNGKSVIFHYGISCLFLALVPSKLLFRGVRWSFDSMFYGDAGILLSVLFVWWMGLVIYSHYLLYQAYRGLSQTERNQVKYFFLAVSIGFTGGSTAYLPNFGIEIYPWGHFSVFLYPFIMAYAIVKHQLMDIRIVLRKTFVYAVLLLLAVATYIAFVVHFTRREVEPLTNVSFLTAFFSLLMSIFIYWKGQGRKITCLWALMCFLVGAWCFGFGKMCDASTLEQSLFWQKWIMYAGAIFIPVIFLHFVCELIKRRETILIRSSYAVSFLFLGLNIFDLLATAKPKPPFPFYTDAIFPTYHLYTLYFFASTIYSHWLLFRRMKCADPGERNQIQYVFVGTGVGFLGGCFTFPLCFDIQIFPIGAYLVGFYLVAVTYAIFKHNLMDIQVVLRKSLIYSVMTAVITIIYLVLLTQGAHLAQRYFGVSTFATSVFAACLIAAIFIPLRSRVQYLVDHYFMTSWQDRAAVREVAAGFSHELKSPLAGLSVRAEMALAELEAVQKGENAADIGLPKVKEGLLYILRQALDAGRRIEAVRGVAEPAAGQVEPVDIARAVENSLAALRERHITDHIDVRVDLPTPLPRARSNAKQLEIVFINLIKNSAEILDPASGGTVSISAAERAGEICVSVRDNGPGIPAKDVGRIFEPYFTTKGRKGMGMGLYLAQQIAKAYGGTIEVISEPGKGSEFTVRLPLFTA